MRSRGTLISPILLKFNIAHLHGNLTVIDEHLTSQEVGPDSSLVAGAELLIDLDSTMSVRKSKPSLYLTPARKRLTY
jgi:hypothetical protein